MIPRLKVHLMIGPGVEAVCGHPNAALLSKNELQVTCLACRRIWFKRRQKNNPPT
jgi:hypothetical protein